MLANMTFKKFSFNVSFHKQCPCYSDFAVTTLGLSLKISTLFSMETAHNDVYGLRIFCNLVDLN